MRKFLSSDTALRVSVRVKAGLMRMPASARSLAGRFARWTGVVGLNYHRIGDGRGSLFDRGLWSATRDGFDRQVRYLKKNFDIIAPKEIADAVRARRGRHVVITFDDGYADNYTEAFPVLKAHGTHGSFFVATGFIDRPRLPWWDEIAWMIRTSTRSSLSLPEFGLESVAFDEPAREMAVRKVLRAYKKMPSGRTTGLLDAVGAATGTGRATRESFDSQKLWMTWDMLREMHAGGMTIGGHTVHHPVLARLSRDEQRAEITTCADRLHQELGAKITAFAYPVGSRDAFNDDTRESLRECGITTAFSYYGGIRTLDGWDDLDIRRIAIEQHTTFDEFQAMVMFPWST
jgi:peptidoglycan/xylan/chitin deacetylase (PgdA/CDA1 family)